ncbi:MAG: hypothetical protein GF331_02750 [Chitinivibrionales bacterium]|nr:hypothetical protein [Chitinivibrionales bacterium]
MRIRESMIALVLVAVCTVTAQSVRWRVTREGWSSGNCRLVSNSLTLTVHPFHVDVVEEAVIEPVGDVRSGDPETLEIFGDFRFTDGTALRSMLLWEGDRILKAKLRDRSVADSAYEDVVDRNIPQVVVRDPALIEYEGDGRYSYQIYPVAMGGSRRIRILYSIPYQVFLAKGPVFDIASAFTVGALYAPSEIPVKVLKGPDIDGAYRLEFGSTLRQVQFDATYHVARSVFITALTGWYATGRCLRLHPDVSAADMAYTATVRRDSVGEHFTAVFATVPENIRMAVSELGLAQTTIEASVAVGDDLYIRDLPDTGSLGVYLKSGQAWDSTIHWACYGADGALAAQYNQVLSPTETSRNTSMLPLLWAAKYTLSHDLGDLGGVYGFVDRTMSLLALEEDSLAAEVAAQWESGGVPPLEPDEVLPDTTIYRTVPDESIMFEMYDATGVALTADATRTLELTLLGKGRIALNLGVIMNGTVAVAVYDMAGRQVYGCDDLQVAAGKASLMLPAGLKGMFVVRVQAQGRTMQKGLVLR